MGGNFKSQVQDSFLEYFFFEIWRSKKQIALSEKKPPLTLRVIQFVTSLFMFFISSYLRRISNLSYHEWKI